MGQFLGLVLNALRLALLSQGLVDHDNNSFLGLKPLNPRPSTLNLKLHPKQPNKTAGDLTPTNVGPLHRRQADWRKQRWEVEGLCHEQVQKSVQSVHLHAKGRSLA